MTTKSKNVLGVCGSPKVQGQSTSSFLLQEALRGAEMEGATTKLVRLVDYNIVPCDGCGDCMNSKQCHLFRQPEDQYTRLYKEIKWADAFIFSSPVYALGLPFTWKLWLDRCEPADEDDLEYQYYNYEVAADVKGKAFQGKVAGQIVTSGGIGQEWALAQLMPLWTNVKLSVVISVGLSMIEFDEQPGIRKKPWGQGVHNAEFAIEIARHVGRRVTQAIGFSTFNVHGRSPRLDQTGNQRDISADLALLKNLDDELFSLEKRGEDTVVQQPLVLVLAGQRKSEEAQRRVQFIRERVPEVDARLVACVDQLPHFMTTDFVKAKIRESNANLPVLIDWDRGFANALALSENVEPHVLIISPDGSLERSIVGTHTSKDILNEINEYMHPAVSGQEQSSLITIQRGVRK
jgi:multimeric flavodoxin WrbA